MPIVDISMIIHFTMIISSLLPTTKDPLWKQVQQNRMLVKWRIEGNQLQCEMSAPTHGWLAVGFNTNNELAGTNLIMGAVEEEFYRVDDRYIVKAGDHRPMSSVGVQDRILQRHGIEEGGKTTITFTIPLSSSDSYHLNLAEGAPYFLLMAYSLEDDFEHHSIMRTQIEINL